MIRKIGGDDDDKEIDRDKKKMEGVRRRSDNNCRERTDKIAV